MCVCECVYCICLNIYVRLMYLLCIVLRSLWKNDTGDITAKAYIYSLWKWCSSGEAGSKIHRAKIMMMGMLVQLKTIWHGVPPCAVEKVLQQRYYIAEVSDTWFHYVRVGPFYTFVTELLLLKNMYSYFVYTYIQITYV